MKENAIKEYPKARFKALTWHETILIKRIKQRVYIDSDEEIMSWIKEHFIIHEPR